MRSWLASLLTLGLVVGTASCEDPTGIGIELQGELPIETYFTDTLKVNTSTVWQDSAFTSNTEGVVIGSYEDPVLGRVSSTAFAQVNLPLTSATNENKFLFDLNTTDLTLDSVGVVMRFKDTIFGDTTQKMKLSVHRLKETISDKRRYISTDAIPYESTVLGQREVGIRDLKNIKGDTLKSIRIVLNKSFGEALWAQANKENGLDINKFSEYLKGLAIVPSADAKIASNFIFTSVDANGRTNVYSHLSLYYHKNGETTRQSSEFTLSRMRFSNISVVKNGLTLDKVYKKGQKYTGESANNRSFVQAGTGLTTRIEIPNVESIKKLGKVAINRAELIIEPAVGTINNITKAPRVLDLGPTETSASLQVLRTSFGAIVPVARAGYNEPQAKYTFNLTNYIQDLYAGRRKSTTFVLHAPVNDDLSRLVVNSANTKIKIYYTLSKN